MTTAKPIDADVAIDKLFQRLAGAYMADWDRKLGQTPIKDVKTVWLHELAGFLRDSHTSMAIAWALERLPERAPNVIEFRNLCRQAPAVEVPQLEAPKADPERVAAELAKMAPVKQQAKTSTYDHKAWAKSLIARMKAGEPIKPIQKRFAHEALGLTIEAYS